MGAENTVMKKLKIAVDARTLGSRPSGVGMYLNDFLEQLITYDEFEWILFTDVKESEYIKRFEARGIKVIEWGKPVYRSAGVYAYFAFIKKELKQVRPDIFWEVNSIIPINLGGSFKTLITIHDMFPIQYVRYFGKIYSYYLLVEFVFPYILYSAGRVAPISVCVFLQRVFKQLKNASKWSRQKVYFERPACKGKSITILCALEFYQAIIISILHHSYARFISPLSPRQAGAAGVAAVWGAPWQCRFARRRSCSGRRAAGWGGSPFQSLAPR